MVSMNVIAPCYAGAQRPRTIEKKGKHNDRYLLEKMGKMECNDHDYTFLLFVLLLVGRLPAVVPLDSES